MTFRAWVKEVVTCPNCQARVQHAAVLAELIAARRRAEAAEASFAAADESVISWRREAARAFAKAEIAEGNLARLAATFEVASDSKAGQGKENAFLALDMHKDADKRTYACCKHCDKHPSPRPHVVPCYVCQTGYRT